MAVDIPSSTMPLSPSAQSPQQLTTMFSELSFHSRRASTPISPITSLPPPSKIKRTTTPTSFYSEDPQDPQLENFETALQMALSNAVQNLKRRRSILPWADGSDHDNEEDGKGQHLDWEGWSRDARSPPPKRKEVHPNAFRSNRTRSRHDFESGREDRDPFISGLDIHEDDWKPRGPGRFSLQREERANGYKGRNQGRHSGRRSPTFRGPLFSPSSSPTSSTHAGTGVSSRSRSSTRSGVGRGMGRQKVRSSPLDGLTQGVAKMKIGKPQPQRGSGIVAPCSSLDRMIMNIDERVKRLEDNFVRDVAVKDSTGMDDDGAKSIPTISDGAWKAENELCTAFVDCHGQKGLLDIGNLAMGPDDMQF